VRLGAEVLRTSTAGVVAVAAVVGGVAMLGSGGNDGTPSVANDVSTPPATTTRVETWRDVSVTVPASWSHGNLDDWCGDGGSYQGSQPVVERPGAISIDILCHPKYGYGVQFSEAPASGFEAFGPGTVNESVGDDYPDGSWQGWDQVGTTRALVVAPTQAEAEQVLGSFAQFKGADANGCSAHPDREQPAVAAGVVRLCRYAGDGWLDQSEILTADDAREATQALDAAPDRPALACPNLVGSSVVVTSADQTGVVQLETCAGLFGWGGVQHDLTADILYWVLSPGWSGQIPDGITMKGLRP
ncbi:MAG: hypothetical protein ABIO16_08720, partial [Nocardioides sp.]